VETYESCQGGNKHIYNEPIVRFHGEANEGVRAVVVALNAGLPVLELRRVWSVQDGELVGPTWEMTFRKLEKKKRVNASRGADRNRNRSKHALLKGP